MLFLAVYMDSGSPAGGGKTVSGSFLPASHLLWAGVKDKAVIYSHQNPVVGLLRVGSMLAFSSQV